MSTAYKKRPYAGNREHKPDEPLGLLGGLDRIEHAPGKAKRTQRYTQYESVRLLFAHPTAAELFAGCRHWCDPCAGDGRMRPFVRQYRQSLDPHSTLASPPTHSDFEAHSWVLADIEPSEQLAWLAESDGISIFNPADMFLDLPGDERVDAVLTNWPWYNWTRHFEKARELYPNAVIAGISCDQERRDGGRADWYKAHRPSMVAALPGRQTFPAPGERGASTYPYTTSWYIWEAGVSDAPRTEMIWL